MPFVSGGGAAGAASRLFTSTLGADAATIDTGALGIAAGSSALYVVCSLRSTRAANTNDVLRFHLNNDSGANYNNEITFATGTTPAASQEFGASGIYAECPAATAPASEFGLVIIEIPSYTTTANVFTYAYRYQYAKAYTAGNFTTAWAGGVYNVTGAAITRLSVVSGNAVNLLAGSSVTVYGLL